ncbi:hypothetical protein LNP25_23690 [Klebsiella variicola subsp. variicola]|nr:hypothetical protein [Klebsiella variicola subsp. variicola]
MDGGVPELKKQLGLNETLLPQIQARSCSAKTISISRKPGRAVNLSAQPLGATAGANRQPASL